MCVSGTHPIPRHEAPRANTSDVALHQRMLELAKSPLIPNLTANFEGSFPGGSHFSLQVLAFYASWLRLRHCPGNVLRLSHDLITLLGRWAVKTDGTEEEKALAKALYDDFSRYDAASSSSDASSSSSSAGALPAPVLNGPEAVAEARAKLAAGGGGSGVGGGGGGGGDDGQRVVLGMDQDDTCRIVADRTLVSSSSSSSSSSASAVPGESNPAAAAKSFSGSSSSSSSFSFPQSYYEDSAGDVDTGEDHKKRGNEAFSRGEWTAAIKHYGKAINAPVSYQKLFDEAGDASIVSHSHNCLV